MSNPAYTDPSYTKTPITGTQLAAQDADAMRLLWKKTADVNEDTHDFWKTMEGSGPSAIIETETDTSKGAGQRIIFTNKSGFYAEPHLGEERFHDSSHYEELRISTNSLKVGWVRHGTEVLETAEEYMGMRGELADGFPAAQGEWLGRLKSERMSMLFRDRVPAANKVVTKGGLDFKTIINMGQTMLRRGGRPAQVGRTVNGEPVESFVVIATTDALTSLKHDSDYVERLKHGAERGMANCIFSGGYTAIDGHIIRPYKAVEHDGYGAIGSPLNPLGRLGIAMRAPTAGDGVANAITTTAGYTQLSGGISNDNVIVLGGVDYEVANTLIKPSKWFPNYAYRYMEDDVVTPTGDAFYVAVVNEPDANNIQKFGLYRCTTNDGVALQVTGVWVAPDNTGAAGAGPEKVADFAVSGYTTPTFDTNLHTTVHPVGSQVILIDPDGVAVFTSLMMGANAARRGYGKYRNQRAVERTEGDFVQKLWVKSVFGEALRVDRLQRARGIMTLRHRGIYSNMPLPEPA